jgi:murein DD-endopeptidase MepM/ murein hydrolase activator NlpD
VNPHFHDEFVALCALYHSGEISEEDWALLQIHMAYCDSCHERFLQYQQISSKVVPAMAAVAASEVAGLPQQSDADIHAAELRLMSRLDEAPPKEAPAPKRKIAWRLPLALAATLLLALAGLIVFRYNGSRQEAKVAPSPTPAQEVHSAPAPTEPAHAVEPVAPAPQESAANLQQQLFTAQDQLKETNLAMAEIERKFEAEQTARTQLSQERDALNQQLTAARSEVAALNAQATSANTSASQQEARVAALQERVHALSAALDDKDTQLSAKDRMLELDKDFLAHDRDIRDVISARNLYIADIFDTGENGRTAKPFGRIFYTKDRSLVFYGFDLDKRGDTKRDASFQVWGRGSDKPVVSLGLFDQDGTNKRWILRCNDAKSLARLDMVFVTVEPPGGSSKPTGKQLLRAYLQIPPNHP